MGLGLLTVVVVGLAVEREGELCDGGRRDTLGAPKSVAGGQHPKGVVTHRAGVGVTLEPAVAPAVKALVRARGALAEVAAATTLSAHGRSHH